MSFQQDKARTSEQHRAASTDLAEVHGHASDSDGFEGVNFDNYTPTPALISAFAIADALQQIDFQALP